MNNIIPRLVDLAIAIQQIPAPTFQEKERAEFVRDRFLDENLKDVAMDAAGNVYGRLAILNPDAAKPGQAVVISAHLDTVFSRDIDLKYEKDEHTIHAPGIGDNSLGVAGLFGLLWSLRDRKVNLPADLWLVANVCEEGLGDLRGMKAVVQRFTGEQGKGKKTPLPKAFIVVEGMSLGNIYHRALGVQRYRITTHTRGGHSWNDYGQPSAIHELTALSQKLTRLEVPRLPRTSLNIGIISGGTSVNTIAAEAMLELDLRSESEAELQKLAKRVEQCVQAGKKPGVSVETEIIGRRPAGEIPSSHPLVMLAQESLRTVGIEPRLSIGSTDANLPLSLGLPCVTIGLTTGSKAHTVHEYINIDPIEKGVEQLVRIVSGAYKIKT